MAARYEPRHACIPTDHHRPRGLSAAVGVGALAVGMLALSNAPANAATLDAHQLHLQHLRDMGMLVTTSAVQVTGIAAYAEHFADGSYYYEYGGEGPTGFDCSGLAQTVYAHFGLTIPRTADEQAGALHQESEASAQPGDLVFYWSGGYAYHTAIYLGNGMVVSALDPSEGIKVTPVSWPGSEYSFGTLR
jgi:hypothetical protein